MKKTIEERLHEKISDKYGKDNYRLQNESGKHHGHAGDDGSGQTHFRLEISSSRFADMTKITAQREVYNLLSQEFSDGLHALSLKLTSKKL